MIINQNPYARNNIGGYSNGGPPAGEAANKGNYDKILLFNTSFYWVNSKPNLADKEIVLYVAKGDSWYGTDSFINEMYKANYKNITVVTNNETIANKYKNKVLIINPGNAMENGHTSNNITKSHYFSYACE